MASTEDVLLALATEQFPDLTDAEKKKLFPAVATGNPADYRVPNEAENDPTHADTWGEARAIRAKVIRWLCVDQEAQRHIDPRGISICAAKIEGPLDLQSVNLHFPLALEGCAIWDGVVLNFAEARLLSFQRSFSRKGIVGESLLAQGNVLLSGLQTESPVRLSRAKITGSLDCTGGTFLNPRGVALEATSITVGGIHSCGWVFRPKAQFTWVWRRLPATWTAEGEFFSTQVRPPWKPAGLGSMVTCS